MLRTTMTRYSILLVVAIVPVLFLTSCIIVPHPMTRRVVGMNGPIKGGIDFKFIVAGTTRADEVREKLKDVDTGFEHERLFWARWCDSHTGITGGVGGYGAAAGGTGRLWGVRNLFVRFDERGIVTSVREFKDGELYAVVTRWVKEADPPALDLSSPVSLMVRSHGWQHYNNVTILLSDGELSFTEDNKPARSFTVKPVEVRSLEGSWARENDIEPRLTSQTIHFSTNTVVGSKLTIDMSALDLMDFAIYLRDQRK